MSGARLHLPPVGRAQATASRARFAHRAPLTLPGNQQLTLNPESGGAYGPQQACITLHWGRATVLVRCPADLPRQMVQKLDSGLEPGAMAPALFGLLLELAMLPLLSAAEQRSGRDIRVANIRLDAVPPGGEGLSLTLDDGARQWPIHVAATGPEGDPLGDVLALWPVAPRAMTHIPLGGALRLGTTRLPVAALRSLEPGDTVLLQTARRGAARFVLAEAWLALAEPDGSTWRLAEAPRPVRSPDDKEWFMQQIPTAPSEGERPVGDPDDIPVQLAFDVGRLDMPLGELRRLGPGVVLNLDREADDLVRISANGRLIGHGVLVDIDGKVGVRIARLFDHG